MPHQKLNAEDQVPMWLRAGFKFVLIVLWGAIVVFLLELVERVGYIHQLHTNQYVLERHEGVIRDTTADTDFVPPAVIGLDKSLDSIAVTSVLSDSERLAFEMLETHKRSGLADSAWYGKFEVLDDEGRQFAACLRGEIVLALDGDGNVGQAYGPNDQRALASIYTQPEQYLLIGLDQEWVDWLDGVRALLLEAVESGESQPLPGLDARWPTSMRCTLVPASGKRGAAAFIFKHVSDPVIPRPEESIYALEAFRYKPNLKRGDAFHTNSIGFRDDEFILPKPEDVFRIVCIGSSTTEEGPSNAETYPKKLERMLRSSNLGRKVEVLNCGIPGMTSGAQVLAFPEIIALEPDLVVVYEGVNDVAGTGFVRWRYVDSPVKAALLKISGFAWRHAWRLLLPPDSVIRETLGHAVENILFLHKAFGAHGIPVIACTIAKPNIAALSKEERFFLDFDLRTTWHAKVYNFSVYDLAIGTYNAMLQEAAGATGLPVVPISDHLQATLDIFTDICHMRENGIEWKARILAEFLSEALREPGFAP